MRIVLGLSPSQTRIYDDKGNDITADLCISHLEITASADKLTTVVLHCHPGSVEVNDCDVHKTFADYTKLKAPDYAPNPKAAMEAKYGKNSLSWTPEQIKGLGSNPCGEVSLGVGSVQSPEAVLDSFKVKPIKPEE
jgi:hypothetical protein